MAGEALEIGGVSVKAGQTVVLVLGSANRDPSVFSEPNQFDVARQNSGQHLTFGFGPHSCLGKQIAALEVSWFF